MNLIHTLPYGPGVIYNGSTGCHGWPGSGGPGSYPPGPPAPAPPLPGVPPPPPPGDPGLPAEEVLPDPAVPPPPALPISNPGVPILQGDSQGIPGEAGDVALMQGRLDASYGVHRPELFSHAFQRQIYEQGWLENQGAQPTPVAQLNPAGADSPLCDPEAAYKTERYNWEIIQGIREGSMTFAPGSSHVVDCPEKWPEIEARVARDLGVSPETIGAMARGEQPTRAANPGWNYRTVNDEGYPWTSSTLHMKNYPMPGSFFDANNPQGAHVFRGPEHFVRALLGSALVMAEMDTSLATSSAGASLRKELSDLHASSEFNDGLFGTSMTALTGGRRGVGPQDRGINWEPRHAPVRDLIGQGKKPYRTTGINGQRLDTYIEANHMPLVWNPAINLDLLRNERRISVEGMQWSDGRSMLEPPASVSALGIDASGVRFPGGMGYARSQGRGSARDWWDRKAG